MNKRCIGLVLGVVLTCAVAACAQPSINANGVVNGAGYAGPAASGANVTIAEGSIVAIFGKAMGPATIVVATSTPLPTQLPNASGTSVKITAGSSSFACYMLYAVSGQVGCIVPSTVPIGTATFAVTYNGQTSAGQAVTIVQQSFALFTKNQGGSGPVVAQNVQSNGSVVVNGLSTSAQQGQILTLYGTGLGPISGADNVPPGAVSLATGVTVTVGGQVLTPLYAGRSPEFAGLDQINVQLPASFTVSSVDVQGIHVERVDPSAGAGGVSIAGCYTPLSATAGTSSPGVVISLATGGGACTHPLGLSPTALATLDAGGTVNIGLALAGRIGFYGILGDGVGAAFFQGNANDVYTAWLQVSGLGVPLQTFIAPGTCITYNGFAEANPLTPSGPSFNYANLLNAGTSLALAGPGVTMTMAAQNGGYATPSVTSGSATFLTNGTWTITGTGGADIGAFTASLSIPIVNWTNPVGVNQIVPRNVPLTINWTGGGPNDIVAIAGASVAIDVNHLNDSTKTYDWVFNCYAAASAGTFTIPTSVLQVLPATVASTVVGAGGALDVSAGNSASFTAPLKKGGNIDAGLFAWGLAIAGTVTWQ